MQYLVAEMTTAIQTPFRFNNGSMGMRPYDWRTFRDYLGHWSGAIEFECGTRAELQLIYDKFHGSGVEYNGVSAVVEIENKFIDLATIVNHAATNNVAGNAEHRNVSSHPLGQATGATGVG
jgi:hypothetical protein